MNAPRFFIHVAAASVEDLIDASERHGAFVEARAYLPPSGSGIYGSIEVLPTGRAERRHDAPADAEVAA